MSNLKGRKSKTNYLSQILVIALMLFVLGLFANIIYHSYVLSNTLKSMQYLRIELKNDANIAEITTNLSKNKIIKKVEFISKEFELLYNMSSYYLNNENISKLYHQLVEVNLKLWEIEDELRVIESTKDFNTTFIELARQVYHTNDERFSLKNKINELTNSEVREQKDYVNYR